MEQIFTELHLKRDPKLLQVVNMIHNGKAHPVAVSRGDAGRLTDVVVQVREALCQLKIEILGTDLILRLPDDTPHSIDLRVRLAGGVHGWLEVKWSRRGVATAMQNGQASMCWLREGAAGGRICVGSRTYPAKVQALGILGISPAGWRLSVVSLQGRPDVDEWGPLSPPAAVPPAVLLAAEEQLKAVLFPELLPKVAKKQRTEKKKKAKFSKARFMKKYNAKIEVKSAKLKYEKKAKAKRVRQTYAKKMATKKVRQAWEQTKKTKRTRELYRMTEDAKELNRARVARWRLKHS